jgi:hypothetical protein
MIVQFLHLMGTASYEPDGGIMASYARQEIAGIHVQLSAADTVTLTYIVPPILSSSNPNFDNTILIFILLATDDSGLYHTIPTIVNIFVKKSSSSLLSFPVITFLLPISY